MAGRGDRQQLGQPLRDAENERLPVREPSSLLADPQRRQQESGADERARCHVDGTARAPARRGDLFGRGAHREELSHGSPRCRVWTNPPIHQFETGPLLLRCCPAASILGGSRHPTVEGEMTCEKDAHTRAWRAGSRCGGSRRDRPSGRATSPSSSQSPYLLRSQPGIVTKSILTVGDSVNTKPDGVSPYRMVGIPDGLGAYDNGDGTFTVLMNHELGQKRSLFAYLTDVLTASLRGDPIPALA